MPGNTTAPESPESPESPPTPGAPEKPGRHPEHGLTLDDCRRAARVRAAFDEEATLLKAEKAEEEFKKFLAIQPERGPACSPPKRNRPRSSVRHHDQDREDSRRAARKRKEQQLAKRKRKEQRLAAREG